MKDDKTKSPVAQLKRIVSACKKDPSLYLRIANRMSVEGKQKVHRQQVREWLHPEEEKRVEPRLTGALFLIRVSEMVIGEAKNGNGHERKGV